MKGSEENKKFMDDFYSDYDSVGGDGDEDFKEWKPQEMNFDMFKLRNDPTDMLETIKLYLMQARKVRQKDNPREFTIIPLKNVKPLVNKQGLQEIMLFLQSVFNNHNVMGNLPREEDLIRFMRFVTDDLTLFMWSKRVDWNLAIENVNPLINIISNHIRIFLSRTVGDKERSHYGEGFKEERRIQPPENNKKNRLADALGKLWRK